VISQPGICDFYFFCTFAGLKKQKIWAFLVFRKYRLKTIYSGTNFSSFLDFRVISQLYHSSVNFCGKTKCLTLLERYFNRKFKKNKKKQQKQLFFLLGVTENGITQKNIFLIFFKFDKLAVDYHSLL
jgi:hypothetical protein